MPSLQELRSAARGLAHHPHDHGWRELHRLFDYGLQQSGTKLERILLNCYQARTVSAAHLLTLLGITLKVEAYDKFTLLVASRSPCLRFPTLEDVLEEHASSIEPLLLSRQNSFTCARRFLVPRIVLDAYFSQHKGVDLRFADFGTGLGVLPRQLNSRGQFEAFSQDLIWPGGALAFRPLPVAAAFGVDKGPMPDSGWVLACYGASAYYTRLYNELQFALHDSDVRAAQVQFRELDLLDARALTSFVRENRINAANFSYVLYEIEPSKRQPIITALVDALDQPGILIVTEPRQELGREGCQVEVYTGADHLATILCFVSDGHFKGRVLPLEDYHAFIQRYPIPYLPLRGGSA